ncbi:hypothetical protein HW132_10430 [Brasilonema sp. CT11]|nr:hypothetical protein [Brasilonema sp. CT11]
MTFNQFHHAIGTFANRNSTVQALDKLRSIDFPMHKVSVVTKKPEPNNTDTTERSITPTQGAAAGGIAGATTGGLLALTGGLVALLIPGLGAVLTVESVLLALLGSATAGSLIGALRGWFDPEEIAQLYDDRKHQKDYLLTLKGTDKEIRRAEPILKQCGIENWRIFDISNK